MVYIIYMRNYYIYDDFSIILTFQKCFGILRKNSIIHIYYIDTYIDLNYIIIFNRIYIIYKPSSIL